MTTKNSRAPAGPPSQHSALSDPSESPESPESSESSESSLQAELSPRTAASKKQWRDLILKARNALPVKSRVELSEKICQRLIQEADFKKFLSTPRVTVGLYRSFQSELDLSPLLEYLHRTTRSWRFCYPRVAIQDSKKLEFVEISKNTNPALSWKISPYGFHEPHPELPKVEPTQIDLLFVPGVVFGEEGGRIGRGAGHYDRFLIEAPKAFRIALAYDCQIVPTVDQDPWDQPMHWILSEKRMCQIQDLNQWWENRKEVQ